MKKTMLLYDLKNKTNREKTHIVRSLFGYKDKSNNGTYEYQREGLLSSFRYEKLDKSVIIVDDKNEGAVKSILKKFGLKILVLKLDKKR